MNEGSRLCSVTFGVLKEDKLALSVPQGVSRSQTGEEENVPETVSSDTFGTVWANPRWFSAGPLWRFWVCSHRRGGMKGRPADGDPRLRSGSPASDQAAHLHRHFLNVEPLQTPADGRNSGG